MTGTDTNKIGLSNQKDFSICKTSSNSVLFSRCVSFTGTTFSALTPYLTNVMVDDYIMKSDLHGLKRLSCFF